MKVFISIKYHEEPANHERMNIICELARKHGMQPVCIPANESQIALSGVDFHALMRRTFMELRNSKLVIIDLTEKGVGVGIEAGYARARGIPIATIAAIGSEISETLAGISNHVFYYEDWDALDGFMSQLEKEFVPSGA
jgi:2'-deoxynucleoside 5'-phosphate N-hydrolase